MYEKAEVSPYFSYGPVISYRFLGNVSKNRGKYRFRYELTFKNGEVIKKQQSGFLTIKEANQKKELLVHEILSGNYCPFSFTVEEYYDYWLSYILEQFSYNTFQNYYSIVRLHLLPKLKSGLKLSDLTLDRLMRVISATPTDYLRKRLAVLLKSSLDLAYQKNYIDTKLGSMVYDLAKTKYPFREKKRDVFWSLDDIKYFLLQSKENYPELYLPLLFSLTLGTRISETIALKYQDIDFFGKTVHISRQLGAEYDPEEDVIKKGEVAPKSYAGDRYIPLPDWVADEIIVKRAWYENARRENKDFRDSDYIICRPDGNPYHRSYFGRLFRPLLTMCGFEQIRWHDLRHIYATMLRNNAINLKAISEFLGHASPEFSENVYITQKEVAYDCTVLGNIWKDVKPGPAKEETCCEIPLPDSLEEILLSLAG